MSRIHVVHNLIEGVCFTSSWILVVNVHFKNSNRVILKFSEWISKLKKKSLSKPYTQCGVWTHDLEIRSHMLCWLRQPGHPQKWFLSSSPGPSLGEDKWDWVRWLDSFPPGTWQSETCLSIYAKTDSGALPKLDSSWSS